MHFVSLKKSHIATAPVHSGSGRRLCGFFTLFETVPPGAYSAWRRRAIPNSTAPAVELGWRCVTLIDRELAEPHGFTIDLARQVVAVERVARNAVIQPRCVPQPLEHLLLVALDAVCAAFVRLCYPQRRVLVAFEQGPSLLQSEFRIADLFDPDANGRARRDVDLFETNPREGAERTAVVLLDERGQQPGKLREVSGCVDLTPGLALGIAHG